MKDTLSYLVKQLLKENKLNIDFDELDFQIQTHPTYPSLHAITGVLDHFNIENLALDVPVTSDTLNQLPNTFLAQVERDTKKQFAVVTKTKDNYQITLDSKNKIIISQSDFLKQFSGIMLAVDKEETLQFDKSSKKKSFLIDSFLLCSAILTALIFLNSNPSLTTFIFLILSFIGIFITINILKQEQGKASILGDAFCSNSTEKKNCNAVLSSKGATIFEGIKLSDFSLIYFAGLSLATFLLKINNSSIFIPMFISIIALPVTLYSIFYQSVVIKKWCFLCLSIVGLMWIHASLSFAYFTPEYNLTSILITVLSFTTVGATWLVKSKLVNDNRALKKLKTEYFKFKKNFELFNSQLSKSKIINTQIKDTKEIIFGNRNSDFHIVMISNPMCGHCKVTHLLINQILRRYSDSIKLTVRFSISPKTTEDSAFKITTRLLELYHTKGHSKCLHAMDDIYSDFTTENWLRKWNSCSNPKTYIPTLREASNWCTENAINFTPEILINGQSYPKTHNRSDLTYFIEELIEQFEKENFQIPFVKA